MPFDDTGFRAYTIDELRAQLRSKYEEESGESPTWEEDTFLGSFSEATLFVLRNISLGSQQYWDALNINSASGRLLDNLGEQKLIFRNEATASRATVTITGTPGTDIPAGKAVQCTVNDTRWETLEPVTIGGGGTVTVLVECDDLGPTPAPAGTLTQIVTPVNGWTSVTNAADATLGNARESDANYRARQIRSLSYLSGRTAPALITACEALDFVTTASVINNTTATATTVGGFTVPAHGHLLIIEPSTLTAEEEEELAQTIFDTIGYGTQQGGSQSAVVTYRGADYTYSWEYATETDVAVDITLSLAPGFVFADVAAEVETAVSAYIGGLTIGQKVRLLGVYAAVDSVQGVEGATVLIEGAAADFAIAGTAVANYDAGGSSYVEA